MSDEALREAVDAWAAAVREYRWCEHELSEHGSMDPATIADASERHGPSILALFVAENALLAAAGLPCPETPA